MLTKPNLSFWKLWNISFGFFGVQIAYALQSANISRIFATLGADPHSLSYFWILPPLMGMIVQPLVGIYSDRTWTRIGRRIPYLFLGALVAVLVMCMLPNAGSFGLTVGGAMIFGVFALMLLDTSINVAMQPFKMMVGDMVNEEQKGLAYSIQSFLCNAGSLIGYLFPFILTYVGVKATAPQGVVPDSVIFSFYAGAVILILCVIYTTLKVHEYPPELHAQYNGGQNIEDSDHEAKKENIITLLIHAPKVFWTVGLVQFFCWAGFMFVWTYAVGTVAAEVFDAPTTIRNGNVVLDTTSVEYQAAGDWNGVLTAVQAIGAMIWAMIIPEFKNLKVVYSLSLIIGGIGFMLLGNIGNIDLGIDNKYLVMIPCFMQGAGWAAMLALPFTLLTNSLKGGHIGTYLGLFNCTICLPQIVAASLGGTILGLFSTPGQLAPECDMIIVAGALFFCGAIAVWAIKEK